MSLPPTISYDYTYEEALKQTGAQSLDDSLKSENFSKLFPLRKIKHEMKKRNNLKYQLTLLRRWSIYRPPSF